MRDQRDLIDHRILEIIALEDLRDERSERLEIRYLRDQMAGIP